MQAYFEDSEVGSILHEVYLKNMAPHGDPFFNTLGEGLERLVEDKDNAAVFNTLVRRRNLHKLNIGAHFKNDFVIRPTGGRPQLHQVPVPSCFRLVHPLPCPAGLRGPKAVAAVPVPLPRIPGAAGERVRESPQLRKLPFTLNEFYHTILVHSNSRSLTALKARWKGAEPYCTPNRITSLGFEKIVVVFLLVAFGMGLAVLVFALEVVLGYCRRWLT